MLKGENQPSTSEDVVWIHVTQERMKWRDLVKTVMNLLDCTEGGEFLV
jgi:predicted RNA-binding protein